MFIRTRVLSIFCRLVPDKRVCTWNPDLATKLIPGSDKVYKYCISKWFCKSKQLEVDYTLDEVVAPQPSTAFFFVPNIKFIFKSWCWIYILYRTLSTIRWGMNQRQSYWLGKVKRNNKIRLRANAIQSLTHWLCSSLSLPSIQSIKEHHTQYSMFYCQQITLLWRQI